MTVRRFGFVWAMVGAVLGLLVSCGFWPAFATDAPYSPKPFSELLATGAPYDPAIPTPAAVTGYEVGQIILPHELLVAYVRAVDAASDRIAVREIGRTHLGRPMFAVFASAPENIARLDVIEAGRAALLEGRAPADDLGVLQLQFGVHGAEMSAYESAPLMLYHLAAAQDAATEGLLARNVVVLVVTLNPDGASRMASWINAHHARVPVANPRHRERAPFFGWGRTNHYLFDLNRQWLPVTQPEAVALVTHLQRWLPNLVVDKHEMGTDATYFWSPGPVEGVHPRIDPEVTELTQALGTSLAAAFDAAGELYVTEELFDDFYLGYGSSYPALMGGIPFLFEQASARGLVQESENGLVRADAQIAEQFLAARTLLLAADGRRDALAAFQRRWFAEAAGKAARDPVKAYLVGSPDAGRLQRFLDMLAVHGVAAERLVQDLRVRGTTFRAGEAAVIRLDQPRYALIRGLMEDQDPGDMVVFYDVSGWTLPRAFGLARAELDAGALRSAAIAPLDRAPAPEALPQATYAYVIDWTGFDAPALVYQALAAGLRAKVVPDPIRLRTAAGEVDVGRGAVVIPVRGQGLDPAEIHALLAAGAATGVRVHAATSGYTPAGSDLGGFRLVNLETPKVLLATGRGVSDNGAGEVWHLLDRELAIPVTMIDVADIRPSDLSEHTHLVLPAGGYGAFTEAQAAQVRDWVRGGGVAIGVEGGAEWLVARNIASAAMPGVTKDGADAADAGAAPDTKGASASADRSTEDAPPAYADKERVDNIDRVSGAIFAGRLDPTHPIGFGFPGAALDLPKQGWTRFAPNPKNPFAAVVTYAPDDPLVSGYASDAAQDAIAGAPAVVAERVGQGAVILFADNPLFRGYWRGTQRLFTNALFFGTAFDAPAPMDT